MMKMRRIEKLGEWGTYAQSFINFKTFYFSMKTKQKKTFSRGEPMPEIKKKTWYFEFFWQFFSNIVNIEHLFRYETYGCNKKGTTLIRLPDLV